MRIMRDVIGSHKIIPCTLITLVHFSFNSVPDVAYTCLIQYKRVYLTVSLQGLQESEHFCLTEGYFVRPLSYTAIYSVDCGSKQRGFESSS